MVLPLVSVVLPIYNVEKYLDRCITSVVNQTYEKLEIILVDDGSPDNCPTICEEWARKDKRIRVVHKENAGLGMARNTGIENATGEYIFFFDSDDYVDEKIVEKCVSVATKNSADLVLYGYFNAYEDGKTEPVPISAERLIFNGSSITQELLPKLLTLSIEIGISAWGKMYRLDLLREHDLKFKSEREIISEDAYFALELFSKLKTAVIIPENLYYYYKNNASLTKAYRKDRQEKNDIYLQKSLEYSENAGYCETVKNAITVRYHSYTLSAIKQVLMSGLSESEKNSELKAIFKNPLLRSTLNSKILNMEKPSLRLFWRLLKLRQYRLCRLLLFYRLKVKN